MTIGCSDTFCSIEYFSLPDGMYSDDLMMGWTYLTPDTTTTLMFDFVNSLFVSFSLPPLCIDGILCLVDDEAALNEHEMLVQPRF